jgi:hypothetical protein
MKFTLKNLQVVMTALLVTATGYVNADCAQDACCPVQEDCCSAPCWGGKGYISADLLIWKAHQDGFGCGCTPHAIDNFITSDGEVISKTNGDGRDPHFKWDPGFRLGAGYEFACQPWEVAVYWSHFHTRNRDHGHHHSDNYFRWKLDYNVVDVILGRKVKNEAFTLLPFVGVRIAKIQQKVRSSSESAFNTFLDTGSFSSSSSSFSSDFSSSPDTTEFFTNRGHTRQKFYGVGPLLGVELGWSFGCGWSAFGYAAVSSLYGHFDIRSHGFSTFLGGTTLCDEHCRQHSNQIATDFAVGIRWKQIVKSCYCHDVEILYQFALEQHRYYNQNRIGDYGDLCLDGFSFSAGFAY